MNDAGGAGARWSHLFDDLESQLEQELVAEDLDLRAEEERLRLARVSVRDRLDGLRRQRGSESTHSVTVCFDAVRALDLAVMAVGRDWISGDLLDGTPRQLQCIVPIASITALVLSAESLEASLEPPADQPQGLTARLGIAFALRDLCRRRRPLDLVLRSGELHGTIDRVGRDHLDLAVHHPDTPRRRSAVQQLRLVPFQELMFVRL